MTRLCMDCRKSLGEKCPKCGTENVVSHLRPGVTEDDKPDLTNTVRVFTCMNSLCPALDGYRRLQFDQGTGGETHGLCNPCLQKRNSEMRVNA